jgi:hypothetical protein
MKRKITILSLLLFVSISSFAQTSTTLQKLINKDWVYIHENPGYEKYVWIERYTQTKQITTMKTAGDITIYDEEDDMPDSDFYLSDQIETTFDYSKVGNVQNGKYIIWYIPEYDGESFFDVEEIITLTDTYLEVKSLESGETFRFSAQ